MLVHRIDAQADQLDAAPVEFRLQLGERAELGRADRGKILGVREQKCPAIADPVVELDFAFGGFGLEIRGRRAHLKGHVRASSHYSYRCFCPSQYRLTYG